MLFRHADNHFLPITPAEEINPITEASGGIDCFKATKSLPPIQGLDSGSLPKTNIKEGSVYIF